MIIGSMNNPRKKVVREIKRVSEMGFGFIDLTSEPPSATSSEMKKKEHEIAEALSSSSLQVVGHTAWYHEFANPYESVRKAHMLECMESFRVLAGFGAKKIGIHPDPLAFANPSRAQYISRYKESCMQLGELCSELGVLLLIETYEDRFLNAAELREVLDCVPEARFTLDIGHANLIRPKGEGIQLMIKEFKKELLHVHASDNDGKKDQHLGLGGGTIDWKKTVSLLKKAGYDGTVTLEVFNPAPAALDALAKSKKKLELLWRSG